MGEKTMNKITLTLTVIIVVMSFCLGAAVQGRAQTSKSFAGVIPFMTSNDRLGFFDQSSGMVYLYDDNISKCLFQGQISTLGSPIQKE
jgi:hypothetical protein